MYAKWQKSKFSKHSVHFFKYLLKFKRQAEKEHSFLLVCSPDASMDQDWDRAKARCWERNAGPPVMTSAQLLELSQMPSRVCIRRRLESVRASADPGTALCVSTGIVTGVFTCVLSSCPTWHNEIIMVNPLTCLLFKTHLH